MNIYQKLITARVELQDMKLKKSGSNQSMKYYQLEDFSPAIKMLCKKHEMMTRLNIIHDGVEKAILTLYNAPEPTEKIDFVCPTAEANLPKGQAIQNLGAKITYLRRYMLMTAFEIEEPDQVDAVNREMTGEVSEEDLQAINSAKSVDELTKLYNELQKVYKIKLITPIFKEARVKLEQDSSEKIIKRGK